MKRTMLPTLKHNAAAGYKGPVKNRALERCRSTENFVGNVHEIGGVFDTPPPPTPDKVDPLQTNLLGPVPLGSITNHCLGKCGHLPF